MEGGAPGSEPGPPSILRVYVELGAASYDVAVRGAHRRREEYVLLGQPHQYFVLRNLQVVQWPGLRCCHVL
jgi:hypothetical protein